MTITPNQTIKQKVREAAANVLTRELKGAAQDGDVTINISGAALAERLAERLEGVGLLSLTGETAIALELVAAGWSPVENNLAEASVHGIHLAGIVLAGEEDHLADYLRVMEAQHANDSPRPLEEYRPLARRLRDAYREASPVPSDR